MLTTGRRVALVVGNGAYQHLPRLDNPEPVYHRQSAGDSGIIFLKRRRFSG
jgi:hypothetical protein